jgi:hypothetical protein
MGDNKLSRSNNDKNTWMVVHVTHNMGEAHIMAGRLQSEGIPAILDHMAGRDAIGITIGTWGEVKVLVHPGDYDEALDLLFPEEPDALHDGESDDVIYYHEDDDDDE